MQFKTVLQCMLVNLALVASAHAGIISWSGPFDTAAFSDVRLEGELVEAINLRDSNEGEVIVNGVAFQNSDALLNQSTSQSFLVGGATSGDAAYDALLNTLDFGNGTSFNLSVGGGSLIFGRRYLIQAWFTDLRDCCNSRVMTLGDGSGNTVDLNATGGGLGQFAVGSFIADDSTQTLSLAANSFGNVHLNAFQVREVSAPSVIALLGLGLMALTGVGRRRQHRTS